MLEILKNTIYKNDEVIVINKKDIFNIHGKNKKSLTYVFKRKKIRYFLVHRIDKYTSGIIIVSRGKFISKKINEKFKDKRIKKYYIAILKGIPRKKIGFIDSILDDKTNISSTYYKLLGQCKCVYSLVEFCPLTGKKHQIRVHATFLKCKVLGDNKYNTFSNKYYDYDMIKLHSYKYFFILRNILYKIVAKLPKLFKIK